MLTDYELLKMFKIFVSAFVLGLTMWAFLKFTEPKPYRQRRPNYVERTMLALEEIADKGVTFVEVGI